MFNLLLTLHHSHRIRMTKKSIKAQKDVLKNMREEESYLMKPDQRTEVIGSSVSVQCGLTRHAKPRPVRE